MTKPARSEPLATRSFIVERFWPGVTQRRADAAIARLGRTASRIGTPSGPVRHLQSALLPADEVVVSMVEAGSMEAVIAVTEQARYPADRISESITVGGRRR